MFQLDWGASVAGASMMARTAVAEWQSGRDSLARRYPCGSATARAMTANTALIRLASVTLGWELVLGPLLHQCEKGD